MDGLIGAITPRASLSGGVAPIGAIAGTVSAARGRTIPEYDGPYEYEPSEEGQTVRTGGFALSEDITIRPIPSNYGRIAYNGSVLTVY